jgi:flavodoxin
MGSDADMNALIIYDSVHGNTEQIARDIADALKESFAVRIAQADPKALAAARAADLLIVGGPTHRHKMSRRLADILKSMPKKSLKGLPTAAFGTRYRMAAWLTGSAADEIARCLGKLGGRLVLPAESFFVERDIPPEGQKRRHDREHLEPGERERAAAWAAKIAKAVAEG